MVLVLTLSVLLVKSVPPLQKSTFGDSNLGIKTLYVFVHSIFRYFHLQITQNWMKLISFSISTIFHYNTCMEKE